MNAIEVSRLSKTYISYKKAPGLRSSLKSLFHREEIRVPAVREITFSISEGELVGLLGPNGAGKTTTLKMLSGILTPTSGEMSILGHNPSKREPAFQKQFSLIMGQKNQLWWDLPASDSFELNKEIYEIPPSDFERRKNELVNLLNVQKLLNVPIRKLSLGERMKMELIGALLHGPKVLFLDEPTIGLDIISQDDIRAFIRRHNQETKTTIVLTSHYMKDVEALCRRIIVINEGVIVYDGLLADLMNTYANVKRVNVQLSNPTAEIPPALGTIVNQTETSVAFEIPKDRVREATVRILSSLPVEDLSIEDPSVEEVVKQIFRKKIITSESAESPASSPTIL